MAKDSASCSSARVDNSDLYAIIAFLGERISVEKERHAAALLKHQNLSALLRQTVSGQAYAPGADAIDPPADSEHAAPMEGAHPVVHRDNTDGQ